MRISTMSTYQNTIQNMDSQQSELAQLEEEASTGVAVATPGDDPLGAAQAVQLSATSSALAQFESNQNTASSLLGTEDTALQSANTTLQSVLTELESVNSGTLTDSNRQAAAKDLEGLRSQLLSLANTTDGTGNFIFAGFATGTAPFSDSANGGVTYNGNTGTNELQISNTTSVATGDNGQSVFMSVLPNVSTPVSSAGASNTGTGIISAVNVTQTGASGNGDSYSIAFTTDPTTNAITYVVTDNSTNPPTVGTAQPFTPSTTPPGPTIDLGNGENVTISGTPAAQGNTDVFSAIDNAIAALQNPSEGNAAATAALQNALGTAQTQITNSMTNISTVLASVGGREQQVTAMGKINQSQSVQTSTQLDDIVQANSPQVFSDLELLEAQLNATESTFASTSKLSLFSMITP